MILNFRRKYRDVLQLFSNKDGLIRKSFFLTLGTAIAQAIPVLFSPILTRLFSPAEFGLLAILTSVTSIISVISTGKYETVILIAKNKRDAVNLIGISLFLSFTLSVLVTILLFFFSDTLVVILNQPRLEHWVFLCPILSFLISIYQSYNEWVVRQNKFSNLALNKVINSGSITISNLFYGFSKIFQGGLILGELTGRTISAISCIYSAIKIDLPAFKKISWRRMIFLSHKNSSCPKYVLPGQLLNTLAGQTSIILIASFFLVKRWGFSQ